ncbi:PLP-dependent aminotransferase family protein [Nocardioides sp. NPDC004968]|uniref:MocR-like transcription factor YczR n=1 Tax=Nocardioides sp. NPDC004968 TaxID=3155894 RepID=UPI0033B39A4D
MPRGRIGATALAGLLGQWQGEGPAYENLAERIQLLLIDGRLSADVRLPSERELSERLMLSRTTITAAYRRLREHGYALSVQGSGTTTKLPPTAPDSFTEGGEIDLVRATLPATRRLPEAAVEATRRLADHMTGPGYTLWGIEELRAEIAARYTDRGLPTDPDQIMVTTGGQSAIALLARTVISRGDRAYAESPSYPNAYDALSLAGARIITSPVTTDAGWDMPAMEAAIARTTPVMAYVMPDFHNPTSRSMSTEDRLRLLYAAAKVDTLLVADDTTAELNIDRPHTFPPLAAMAGEHQARVVHIGSASKMLWGGLRVGWIRADPVLLTQIASGRSATDLGTPIWEQLVTTILFRHLPEILEERAAQLAAGRAALYHAMREHLPDWELPPRIDGGLSAWVGLPAPVSSQLTLATRPHGLLVTAGPRFGVDGAYERHLRLAITPRPELVRRGVEILAEVWPRAASTPALALTTTEAVV